MRARIDGRWRETDALDLRTSDRRPDPEAVRAAVETGADWLECASPGDLWTHVGCLPPRATLRTRAALAAAARSRGLAAPQDEEREAVLARRAAITVESVDATPLRRRLAEADRDADRLRETVARLQGRVRAAREAGEATDGEPLRDAIRRLSERETDRAAATQALDRVRRRQRAARDAREERRRLADRAANLARAARRHLAVRLEPEFRAAVAAAPSLDTPPTDPFEADPTTRALAVAHLGTLRAPIVLAFDPDRFASARAAADWLDAPVVRL
jgi:hypothetical protein